LTALSGRGRQLTLVLPGLAGPLSDPPVSAYLEPRPVALDRLLSRCAVGSAAGNDFSTTLAACFGLQHENPNTLAVAALTCLSDTGNTSGDHLMRADPVHLRADQSSLRLFDSHSFTLTQDEADELVAAFNSFYAERGWHLEAPRPQRWYLSMRSEPGITTQAIGSVIGQSIDACLPRGEAAPHWHATMNEIQMLFHAHPVNAAREQRGEPVINSVWFWGGGAMPANVQTSAVRIATDHPLAMGLAQQAGASRMDVPANGDELLAALGDGETLVVNDVLEGPKQYGDIESWLDGLLQLEQHWFTPLLAAIRSGSLDALEIRPCNGCRYFTNRKQQRAFWKRQRFFEDVCAHD
jgi:hypothetical protein